MNSKKESTEILQRIRDNLKQAEMRARRLRKTNAVLVYTSIGASGFATIVGGLTAGLGPLIGQGTGAWRFTCGAIAASSAIAGFFTGMHQRLSISERLTRSLSYLGKLRSLEIALTVSQRDPNEVAKEYERIYQEYQEFLV